MRKSKFTEEQITYALRQVESGTSAAQLCLEMGITDADVLPMEAQIRRRGRG